MPCALANSCAALRAGAQLCTAPQRLREAASCAARSTSSAPCLAPAQCSFATMSAVQPASDATCTPCRLASANPAYLNFLATLLRQQHPSQPGTANPYLSSPTTVRSQLPGLAKSIPPPPPQSPLTLAGAPVLAEQPLLQAQTQVQPTTPSPASSFYRRALPEDLVSFTSTKGRQWFKESLVSGHAEGYFNLAGNFTTQSEPAYCGPSSLAMVLNALEVDPGRPWKGVWRWYSDELIQTCATPEAVLQQGITFDEFTCMATEHCDVVAKRGDQVSRAEFLADIERVCASTDTFMVVSFSRKTLNQTGDGHFSPIGAYHASSQSVLVLDTARFKYPSYFVSVDSLYNALQPVDKATGKPRGYFLIRALPQSPNNPDSLPNSAGNSVGTERNLLPRPACSTGAPSKHTGCRNLCGRRA